MGSPTRVWGPVHCHNITMIMRDMKYKLWNKELWPQMLHAFKLLIQIQVPPYLIHQTSKSWNLYSDCCKKKQDCLFICVIQIVPPWAYENPSQTLHHWSMKAVIKCKVPQLNRSVGCCRFEGVLLFACDMVERQLSLLQVSCASAQFVGRYWCLLEVLTVPVSEGFIKENPL